LRKQQATGYHASRIKPARVSSKADICLGKFWPTSANGVSRGADKIRSRGCRAKNPRDSCREKLFSNFADSAAQITDGAPFLTDSAQLTGNSPKSPNFWLYADTSNKG
jgi:hypothetical protein